jgi:hypothetical protein
MEDQQQQPGEGNVVISGTINQGQGFSIGPGSSVHMTVIGNLSQKADSSVDLGALKESLTDLYQLLAAASLPVENKMKLQTLTGQAVELTEQEQPDAGALTAQIKQLGETFQSAGETIAEGATVGKSILMIARLVGPLVAGGARVVAAWFGLHFPG